VGVSLLGVNPRERARRPLEASDFDVEEFPVARYAVERLGSAAGELYLGADEGVAHRLAHEDLAGRCEVDDASADVNGDPGDVVVRSISPRCRPLRTATPRCAASPRISRATSTAVLGLSATMSTSSPLVLTCSAS
jgi:hypothetical protein